MIPKWNQTDISNTIVLGSSKTDLYGLLEGMFSWILYNYMFSWRKRGLPKKEKKYRSGSRNPVTSKTEFFVTLFNALKNH